MRVDVAFYDRGLIRSHTYNVLDAKGFDPSKHPRGQPENKGEFAKTPGGGAPKAEPTATAHPNTTHPNFSSGPQLTPTVFRGSSAENEQRSAMAPDGVYVSTDPETAKQWGNVKEYVVHKQPKLMDLGSWYTPGAKVLVARQLGMSANRMSKSDFDEGAVDVFVQNEGVNTLRRFGYDGYRLGRDAFLLGDLNNYATEKKTKDASFDPSEHPRGQPENKGEFAKKGSGTTATAQQPGSPKQIVSSHLELAPANRAKWPAHLKALRIPPAWTNVRISSDPNAALQAIGSDIKGRKQYLYHPKFAASQAAAKFQRIKELDQKFDSIRTHNAANQKSPDPLTREHADVSALIMEMGIRPGSENDTKADQQAYGATTLLGKHVSKGKQTRLRFIGKKGVSVDLPVESPSLARMLLSRASASGANGQLFPNVSAGSLLDYVHKFDGGGFKTKDLRTLLAARLSMREIQKTPAPKNPTQYKKAVKQVATAVSQKLGNTPTVALQSYIPPELFAEWRAGAGV